MSTSAEPLQASGDFPAQPRKDVPMSDQQIAEYTKIIDEIIAHSDLQTVSAGKIRRTLQAAVNTDLDQHKDPLRALIEKRFDVATEAASAANVEMLDAAVPNHTNSESAPSASVAVKDDAILAAELQAQENARVRSRQTRAGNSNGSGSAKKRSAAASKKSPKKKSASKIEDSDAESGSGVEKTVKRNGAFHKPMYLSPALTELTGETQLSRPQTVKKIWDHVKAFDLQDPNDKRMIRCDEKLRNVFKQDSVHMFTMNKLLSKQLYPVDE